MRKYISDLLFKLSTSSSVTCPPNTTLLIPSDGCHFIPTNSESQTQKMEREQKKKAIPPEMAVVPGESGRMKPAPVRFPADSPTK